MKKFLAILMIAVMVIGFAACGEIPYDEPDTGILSELVPSEEPYITYYGDTQSLAMALINGEVDQILGMPECVGRYAERTIPEIKMVGSAALASDIFNLNLAVLSKNSEIFEILEQAIETLSSRGTLDSLKNKYVTAYFEGKDIPEIESFLMYEGRPTIKVAVTGDYPLLETFSSSGTSEGLARAVLVEISKTKRVNIELYVINAEARLDILETGYADAIFCTTGYTYAGGTISNTNKIPDDVSITTPIYTDNRVTLVRAE